jgi:hypothetical protein
MLKYERIASRENYEYQIIKNLRSMGSWPKLLPDGSKSAAMLI